VDARRLRSQLTPDERTRARAQSSGASRSDTEAGRSSSGRDCACRYRAFTVHRGRAAGTALTSGILNGMPTDPPDGVANLLDAFMHPPRLYRVAHRTESPDGRILIVTHVELWPWRIVIRGARAIKPAPPRRLLGEGVPTGDQPPGSVRGAVRDQSPAEVERARTEARWFTDWQISDDVGTSYLAQGSHSGGNETWTDYAIEFQPSAPAGASHLTITIGDGEVVELTIDPS
jgi:hypothetical protein